MILVILFIFIYDISRMEVHLNALWLTIFVLSAILPSLVVAVVFLVRFEALRGDVKEHIVDVNAKLKNVTQSDTLVSEATDRSLQAISLSRSLEESFTRLNNKLVSRERVEKAQEARERKRQQEEEEAEYDEIPGTEQQEMFPTLPFPINQQQNGGQQRTQDNIVRSTRKFGEIP